MKGQRGFDRHWKEKEGEPLCDQGTGKDAPLWPKLLQSGFWNPRAHPKEQHWLQRESRHEPSDGEASIGEKLLEKEL